MSLDHCITLEGDRVFFTINGQKIPAEDVKCIEPARLEAMCKAARLALTGRAAKYIELAGSIAPPRRKRWKP